MAVCSWIGPKEQLPPEAPCPQSPPAPPSPPAPAACIVEYGKALDISYLQYLWEAHTNILHCMRDCRVWSALYDGDSPDPETFLQSLPDESRENSAQPEARVPQQPTRTVGQTKDKNQSELEWDDSYDTGISSGADAGSPGPYDDVETSAPPAPVNPPKHIQEMKKTAILLFKGSYIEESDFQDDVMVYRLCAEKDSEDTRESQGNTADRPAEASPKAQPEVQSPLMSNGPLFSPDPEAESQPSMESSDLCQRMFSEAKQESEPDAALESNLELTASEFEAEVQSDLEVANSESEDLIAQYDQLIQELDSGTEGLMDQSICTSDPPPLTNQEERPEEGRREEEEDFDSLMAETPAVETVPSPFGVRENMAFTSRHPVRTQSTPFTGDNLSCFVALACAKAGGKCLYLTGVKGWSSFAIPIAIDLLFSKSRF